MFVSSIFTQGSNLANRNENKMFLITTMGNDLKLVKTNCGAYISILLYLISKGPSIN